ncbi:hypothetical protein B488_05850 [Liberibacter crescens BT-1]|uniref:Murein endopeptidase K n=1 Tax=Liberibacter crescens (strain BT-1) TaxID=1215343 RepID=L0EUE9_LIBCB|nr:DUF882 domain-containing protein [Liberibacter crescens]AGA64577.1 hypothetical protein B488_05850 [Liberibacter crescens BT-1]
MLFLLQFLKAVFNFLKKSFPWLAVFLLLLPIAIDYPLQASPEIRTLKLYLVHTGEKIVVTFKRNGKYDHAGLLKLSRALRDWRRNQVVMMDPRLFDLIWNVYRQVNTNEYIHVLCGFRSRQTNYMLRLKSSKVAENSQHILGKAMDFYIPGVPLKKLREVGMRLQGGGVGYYPESASPFVHLDVGGVRAWPRMTRYELARLFPDGKTMHLPSDGKPMPGYQQALNDYKNHMVNYQSQIGKRNNSNSEHPLTLMAMLFSSRKQESRRNYKSDKQDSLQLAKKIYSTPVSVAKHDTDENSAPTIAIDQKKDQENLQQASLSGIPIPQYRSNAVQEEKIMAFNEASPSVSSNPDEIFSSILSEKLNNSSSSLLSDNVPIPAFLERPSQNDNNQGIVMAYAEQLGMHDLMVPTPVTRPLQTDSLESSNTEEQNGDETDVSLTPEMVKLLEEQIKKHQLEDSSNHSFQKKNEEKRPPENKVASLNPSSYANVENLKGINLDKRVRIRAKWAFNKQKISAFKDGIQPVRFSTLKVAQKPTMVYVGGFSSINTSVDSSHFTGAAVNFMKAYKF